MKIIESLNQPASNKNNGNRLAFEKNNDNNKINRFSIGNNNMEYAKKSRKLKSKKLFKSQYLAKSRKMLSKKKNLPNFNTKKAGLNFLIFNTKIIFNYLWLVFTKTLIF